jgi:four helix bundle protein
MAAKTFRDLIVWQQAYTLTLEVYKATQQFPKEELYGLTNQIRRATVSITSNIAEGFGRAGSREKDQFYAIAHGSLMEVESQLLIAKGLGYGQKVNYTELEVQSTTVSKLLHDIRRANKEKGARM